MTVGPIRLAAVLLGMLGMLGLLAVGGCAGTDASGAPAGSSASAPSATTTSSPAADEGGRRIEVDLTAGQATGDTGRIPVGLGESVTLALTSDVADEVHVHGYDLTVELDPGQQAEVTFAATVPGVFEVELHEAGTVLLTLQVQ
jgi:heme/copper-type cytochrome/quinol oxidase subunit 2